MYYNQSIIVSSYIYIYISLDRPCIYFSSGFINKKIN